MFPIRDGYFNNYSGKNGIKPASRKVLLPLGCSTVLGYLVDRIKTLELNKGFNIIVATTSKPEDDAIADFCKLHSISCFRGSENNVLDRFYNCAKKFGTDIVIRLTADCPLSCPDQILRLYNFFQHKKADYVYFDESFPEGICADIFSFDFLQEAWKNSTES